MTNGQIRDLCIGLLSAETESEVIELLNDAGYWETGHLAALRRCGKQLGPGGQSAEPRRSGTGRERS